MTTTSTTGSALIDTLAADVIAVGGTVAQDGGATRWEFTVPRQTLDTATGETRPSQWNAGSAGYYVRDGRRHVRGVAAVRETMRVWGLAA